jgi:hypothetical protein
MEPFAVGFEAVERAVWNQRYRAGREPNNRQVHSANSEEMADLVQE